MSLKPNRTAESGTPAWSEQAAKMTGRYPFRLGLLVGVIITVAVVLLIVQNGESARLDWLTFHFEANLWIILTLTFVAGAIVWEAAKAAVRRGRRRVARLNAGEDLGSAALSDSRPPDD